MVHDHWKTVALTLQTLVGRVMSLLFNTLCRFVIAFLPRGNPFLISWLQSTILSDCRAQEDKICQFPPFSLLFAMK